MHIHRELKTPLLSIHKLGPLLVLLEMKFNTLFIIFVISVAILSHTTAVEASRLYMLCEGFGNVNNLERSSSVYEKAKNSMACLLERLPSGPSPGGIGH